MDADELALLRATLDGALGTAAARGSDADQVLEEFGIADLLGDGGPELAVAFEELGRKALPSSLLDAMLRQRLGLAEDKVAIGLPMPGRRRSLHTAVGDPAGAVDVEALLAVPSAGVDQIVVTGATGGSGDPTAWVGRVSVVDLAPAPVAGLDPASGLWQVVSTVGSPVEVVELPGEAWASTIGAGRRALASELVGLSKEICRIAIDHVTTRHQFGRPLGGFQAVRHRLAEAHVEIAAADAVLASAWDPRDILESAGDDLDEQILGAAAKAAAGRAYETSSRHALQVCGAMGVTWEFPLHRLVRRGAVLNGLLGDATDLTAWLGARILRGEPMPVFDPLVPATSAP